MNIAAALIAACEVLQQSGVADPGREASSLLAFALKRPPTFLIAHPEHELTINENALFDESVKRRSSREPFQYIVGRQEFYGLDFEISPDVLIPRPETEILVEDAIKSLQGLTDPTFCEIGVGSGCISVSILHNVANSTAVGIDISEQALAMARRNAAKHEVLKRIQFCKGDVFEGVTGKFDLIVSNPPYIPVADIPGLQPEVLNFEPHLALVGGSDGLDVVRRIVLDAPEHLTPRGVLLVEIGFGQSEPVRELFDLSMWETPDSLPDLQGVRRVLKVRARS